MASVKVYIRRIIYKYQPYFVECELTDSGGKKHFFEEKLPIVCGNDDATPPCFGEVQCQILEERTDTFVINTKFPADVTSTEEKYIFEVDKEKVIK